jgi:tetratricopeptide (TPR) repeat protein
MQRLREALEARGRSVRVVRFDPEAPHLFSTLASLPIDSSSVVFVDVRGIELARLDPANYPEEMGLHQQALNARRALQSLNLQREQLATLGIPLLFWVSAQALGQIAQRAADLFAARSGIFDLRTFWPPEPFPREGLLDIVYLERETRLPALPRAIQDLPSEELRRRFQLYERRLREEEAKTPPHFPRQASLHQELARIAWALGEITRALEHQEAATALYRKLATEVGEDFLPHLAAGLNNLSEILSALGRRAEALEATQEAVELYRRLAQPTPRRLPPRPGEEPQQPGHPAFRPGPAGGGPGSHAGGGGPLPPPGRPTPRRLPPRPGRSLHNLGNPCFPKWAGGRRPCKPRRRRWTSTAAWPPNTPTPSSPTWPEPPQPGHPAFRLGPAGGGPASHAGGGGPLPPPGRPAPRRLPPRPGEEPPQPGQTGFPKWAGGRRPCKPRRRRWRSAAAWPPSTPTPSSHTCHLAGSLNNLGNHAFRNGPAGGGPASHAGGGGPLPPAGRPAPRRLPPIPGR